VVSLPRDWLVRFAETHKTEPLRIGKRLVITNVGATLASRDCQSGSDSRRRGRSHIVIPAGAAFGTGQHPTTAMSLRLLERLTRFWGAQAASLRSSAACRRTLFKEGSSRTQQAGSLRSPEPERTLLDLGTGTGILALAAARF